MCEERALQRKHTTYHSSQLLKEMPNDTLMLWYSNTATLEEEMSHHCAAEYPQLPTIACEAGCQNHVLSQAPVKRAVSSGDTVLPPTDVTSSVWLSNKSLPAHSSHTAQIGACLQVDTSPPFPLLADSGSALQLVQLRESPSA